MSSPTDDSARPRVVFFGSGPVAAASLKLLLEWCDVEAVITKPQPPHHKEPFPVLVLARQYGLTVLTPHGKRQLSELFAGKPVTSTLGVVIDYGFIINQDVIDYFRLGIINSHFSLLPEWRGADPITFAVLSGQRQTGISLMRIVAAMDEGPLLAQATFDVPTDITTPELTSALIELSDKTLQAILPLYIAGEIELASQEAVALPGHNTASYSRKLSKQDGVLDFNKSAVQLEREVRAFIEWPKSRTTLAGKDITVTTAHPSAASDDTTQPRAIGEAFVLADKSIAIKTSDGLFVIDRLKPAGKPEMSAQAFLAGNKL